MVEITNLNNIMKILLLLCMTFLSVFGQNAWEKPGCHRLGYTRTVSIPGCVEFTVSANACRGYCASYSFPSSTDILELNPNQIYTSRSECCTIHETHDVKYNVKCLENGQIVYKEIVFKSASTCQCSVCRHGN